MSNYIIVRNPVAAILIQLCLHRPTHTAFCSEHLAMASYSESGLVLASGFG